MEDKKLKEAVDRAIDDFKQNLSEENREILEYKDCENECGCGYEGEEDYEVCSAEELINQIAAQEELKRIEIQDNPKSKASKELKSSKTYKELTDQAYIVGECLQILLGYGMDYSNAVAISSNLIQNKVNVDLAQVNVVNAEKQSI